MATTPRINANRLNIVDLFPMAPSYGHEPGVIKRGQVFRSKCSLPRNDL